MDCGSLLPLFSSQPAGAKADKFSFLQELSPTRERHSVRSRWNVRRQQAAF
jgi:hypothetical protein